MAFRDLHHSIHAARGISPAAAVADNTAFVSQIVDTKGYDSVEFLILTGALADADATFTVLVEDGNVANLSDAATVASKFLIGTIANASFDFSYDDRVRKIGYVGDKRYVRVQQHRQCVHRRRLAARSSALAADHEHPVTG